MDGVLSEKEFNELLDIAKNKCQEIRELEAKALKEKYAVDFNGD